MRVNQISKLAHPRPWQHRKDPQDPMISSVVDANGRLIAGSFICRQSDKQTVASHALMVQSVNLLHACEQDGLASTSKTKNMARWFAAGCPEIEIPTNPAKPFRAI